MTKAILLFPGQGSQHLGMGRALYNSFPEARETLQEADDTLQFHLSKLIFDGDEAELTLTSNAQPAILAVSVAVARVLTRQTARNINELGLAAAGHSLGEYSALCATGAFSFADALRLVRKRGQAMQGAVPVGRGSMAALVGATLEQAETIAQMASEYGICGIANDNGAGQVVLSGEKAAITAAINLAAEHGVRKAVELAVSAPFHSSLMQPAAESMEQALSQVKIALPLIPIFANITAQPIEEQAQIKPLLVQQVCGMVRWRQTIENMLQAYTGAALFELGPGNVLTGINKRMAPENIALNLSTPEDIEQCISTFY